MSSAKEADGLGRCPWLPVLVPQMISGQSVTFFHPRVSAVVMQAALYSPWADLCPGGYHRTVAAPGPSRAHPPPLPGTEPPPVAPATPLPLYTTHFPGSGFQLGLAGG